MPRPLDGAVGERLELASYYADFAENYGRAREFWKLERGQVYAEPANESWKAFDRGDWEEALRIGEERQAGFREPHRRDAARGMASRRVRIASLPPSGYLQWELHLLRVRDEIGDLTRVLLDGDVADLESEGPLPDICTLDATVMYDIIYDENGVLDHAVRYADPALVKRCRDLIAGLYARGEPIAGFFEREIAHLPPPCPPRRSVRHDYFEHAGRPRPPRT